MAVNFFLIEIQSYSGIRLKIYPLIYANQLKTLIKIRKFLCFTVLWLTLFYPTYGQTPVLPPDSLQSNKKLKLAAAGLTLGYTGAMIALSNTWYKESDRTKFHFFNDNHEWKQLDKAGHFWGSFHESRLGVDALKAAQVPTKKAIIYGSLLGFILQSPIELLDGYATDYGASVGDLGANAAGSLAVMAQQLTWGELRFRPKYSFHRTRFADQRPAVLGSTFAEQLLKDYNGQTYWLAGDVAAFLPPQSRYPKWLNVALGYGAEQMVYGQPTDNKQNGFNAYRQYYLALDINLLHIPTRHKWLRYVFYVINTVHLPAPAVEYNRKKGLLFHPLYF